MTPQSLSPLSRRSFIRQTTILATALAVAAPLAAAAGEGDPRSLSFYHTHTRQHLEVTYARGRSYDPRALEQVDHYLRDFRTGEEHPIDRRLLDLLWELQQDVGHQGVFEVISGFRSPTTNQQLRQQSSGVAKRSLHMEGRAIDIRLAGVPTRYIQQCAVARQCGGVGYYPSSDFVHLDTGRFRTW
ncbi:YcbK family protein [Desulfogranum mediterraneum]|uniref:YcbK family protein n=1 Tax=Desulfogranum mediterraneum TaxID=160661 RepID=UPI00048E4A6A|nr:DUF882 domain-containing protein [Desulfogranum mediterraneum]